VLGDIHGKISFLSGDTGDLGKGKKLYIDVPADLDQFRRNNSHGTVIGGKRLIQLRHHPTDGACLLYQINIETGIREIKGRLHTGDSTTYNHYRADLFLRHFLTLT
jgi:hypothetical protein